MKSYTDVNQSKKLAEVLSLESADNVIVSFGSREGTKTVVMPKETLDVISSLFADIRETTMCWSLAALLDVLPKEFKIEGQRYAPCLFPVQNKWLLKLWYNSNYTIISPIAIFSDNPVDAYVDMILKLKERNLI